MAAPGPADRRGHLCPRDARASRGEDSSFVTIGNPQARGSGFVATARATEPRVFSTHLRDIIIVAYRVLNSESRGPWARRMARCPAGARDWPRSNWPDCADLSQSHGGRHGGGCLSGLPGAAHCPPGAGRQAAPCPPARCRRAAGRWRFRERGSPARGTSGTALGCIRRPW